MPSDPFVAIKTNSNFLTFFSSITIAVAIKKLKQNFRRVSIFLYALPKTNAFRFAIDHFNPRAKILL